MTSEEAKIILEHLRGAYQDDKDIINDFGEHVWLGPCLDAKGNRIGITDCCMVSSPCPRHAKMKPSVV